MHIFISKMVGQVPQVNGSFVIWQAMTENNLGITTIIDLQMRKGNYGPLRNTS